MAKSKKQAPLNVVEQKLADIDIFTPVKKPTGDDKEISELINQRCQLAASENVHERIRAHSIGERIKTAVIRMVYGKADPRDVPQKYIRHALENPVYSQFEHIAGRKTIGNPNRGIRVFCMECQGGPGNEAGIRECAAINCPLWAFRMGTNPYFGRIEDADAESTETEAEMLSEETNVV